MTCTSFRRHYSAFRDAQDPAREGAMREHLDHCDDCRARHRALDIGVRVLRAQRSALLARPESPVQVLVQTELPI